MGTYTKLLDLRRDYWFPREISFLKIRQQLESKGNNSHYQMPGHVKKSSGPDPDPSKWLFLSFELKEKLKVSER